MLWESQALPPLKPKDGLNGAPGSYPSFVQLKAVLLLSQKIKIADLSSDLNF